jgi:hypothetical protein
MQEFELAQADDALINLKKGQINGAAVLTTEGTESSEKIIDS